MTLRPWLRATAALAVLAVTAASAAAQRLPQLSPEDYSRFNDIRDGKKPFVNEPNKQDAQKNIDAIKRRAQLEVARMLDSANTSAGSSDTKPISQVVRSLHDVIIDPLTFGRTKLSEGQRDMIRIFGEEMNAQLRPIFGTKDKPSTADVLVRLNAARQLSIVAKSGFDELADTAVEVIADPNQHDAVKLYMFEALGNLFAVPHPEQEGKSVFTKEERENKAIQTLIDFIARQPKMDANASRDEIAGVRYVRREAIRALGQVRKPVVRDANGKIVMSPGIWLLRVANADRNFVPPVSLSERVEGLVGYLNLQADKEQAMDFAAGFIATAIRDLGLEYKERKLLEKIKVDDKAPPERAPDDRDMQAWKLTANRIQLGLKVWRDNWENPAFGARPADIKAMMQRVSDTADRNILRQMIEGGKTDEINLQPLDDWLRSTQFPSASLFPDDKTLTIVRPDAGR